MSYSIDVLEEEQCVVVVHTGETPISDFIKARNKAAKRLKEKGWSKIIFDSRAVEHTPTLIEAYGLTAGFTSVFSSETHIAVLINPDRDLDVNFLEDSAKQTYGLSFKIFNEYKAALQWLVRSEEVRPRARFDF